MPTGMRPHLHTGPNFSPRCQRGTVWLGALRCGVDAMGREERVRPAAESRSNSARYFRVWLCPCRRFQLPDSHQIAGGACRDEPAT